MKPQFYLLILIITLFSSCPFAVQIDETTFSRQISVKEYLVLNPISSITFEIDCAEGDILEGEFRIVTDGDRFPGDQTKYDNWLLGGINFLILNEFNYYLWNQSELISSEYEKNNVIEHKWQFNIPSSGTWYLIYINNTIYMKQIENTVIRRNSMYFLIPIVLGLLGLSAIFGFGLVQRVRKKELWHSIPQHSSTIL